MHAKELERYGELLVEKRRELLSARTGAGIPPAGRVEGDPVDQATAEAEAELKTQLHRTDGRLLRAIDEALDRINHCAYGVCESCRGPIARARLEAVPWARHCLHCKEQGHSGA
jgi:DnaK suppressor protein